MPYDPLDPLATSFWLRVGTAIVCGGIIGLERQLRRWSTQWDQSKAHDLPTLDALRDHLVATFPVQREETIVHGDFRLDNTILHPTRPGSVLAVLDWEMSTLGDPLADLGTMLAYWSEEGDDEVLASARILRAGDRAAWLPLALRRRRALTSRCLRGRSQFARRIRRSPSSSSR